MKRQTPMEINKTREVQHFYLRISLKARERESAEKRGAEATVECRGSGAPNGKGFAPEGSRTANSECMSAQ